ncbi:hypothetical protein QTO34_016847 [Cnephaeus nilssonii]|uniref:Uncharacterized protein n=1 Tax=Cnephaeus nilssonii TaxID=3371016 RepID=A0AA40I357_CNENI|nr:hypothetical protein QTO34_016847 [Eptesicus nilssonii]
MNNPQPQAKTNPGRYNERPLSHHWSLRRTKTIQPVTLGMKTKICGCKIKVRPWNSPDPSISLSNPGDSGIRAERQRPWNSTTQPTVKDAYSPGQPGREEHHSPDSMEARRMTIPLTT